MATPVSMRRRCAWFAFAALTVLLGAALPTQRVDAHNEALKAPHGPDATRRAALAEVVPADPVVLVAFVAAGDLAIADADRMAIAEARSAVAALPAVASIATVDAPDPGIALLPVAIQGDDHFVAAEAVVAAARAHAPPTLQVLATGLPLLEGSIARLVAGERSTIVPLLLLVLCGTAWAVYRRLRLAIAVLLPPLAAIAWTGGTLAWLGHRLDPIAALLEPVLLTIGVAASVHFVEATRAARARGLDAAAAARAAAAELRTPALLATATTMLGLWSLVTGEIPAVRDFGLRAALGVALTHAFAFLMLPAWLGRAGDFGPLRSRRGTGLFRWLQRHRTALLVATCGVTTLAVAELPRLRADNDPVRLLPANDAARVDHDVLAQRLGGVELFHLLVPRDNALAEPSRLLPLVGTLRGLPGIAGLGGPVLRGADGQLAVPLLLQPGGSAGREATFAACERIPRVLGGDGVVPAGASVQIARDSQRLLESLLGSTLLAVALLGASMAVGLRSWRLAVVALLVNVLPSVWLYGALAWWGRPVSVATAMIGCTMLGLVVDNALHLLHHYRHWRASASPSRAMRRALGRCQRPMLLASVVLAAGFAGAATSELATTVEFGLLATATIAMAWLATAVVLPALFADGRSMRAAGGNRAP